MSYRFIYPVGMSVQNWCNQMALALTEIGPTPTVRNESDWKHWARTVASTTNLSGYQIASPNGYSDWKQWANQFIRALDAGI